MKKCIIFSILFLNTVIAFGDYKYIFTVGKDPNICDYTTINEAIKAVSKNKPDAENTACIEIYDGAYVEQLNSFYPGGNNLPKYCDLIGMGKNPGDVIIKHKRRAETDPNFTDIASEIYAAGIKCDGFNKIENIKVFNDGSNQNTIMANGELTLNSCIILSYHDAVTATGNLIINNCQIEGWYRACVQPYSTFNITNTSIFPKTRNWGGQHPSGIEVHKSGIIDNVIITADIESSDYEPHYDTPWLVGVVLQMTNANDTVSIKNTTMDLTLTTLFNKDRLAETADWELFGIVNGGRNPDPTTYYPGKAIVENCTIKLNGIESSTEQGDGRAIMEAGICVQGGGKISVIGKTTIETSRKEASFAKEGFEYALINKNGVLEVESATVIYDANKTSGEITVYLPFGDERQKYLIVGPEDLQGWKIADFATPLSSDLAFPPKEVENKTQLTKLIDDSLLKTVIVVDKDIVANTTWNTDSIYLISGNVNIQAGLTIKAGAVIKYAKDASLLFNNGGKLTARGTANALIYFVPDSYDDGYGYYDCAICIQDTASTDCEIENCVIEGAVIGIKTENIKLNNAISYNYFLYNVYGIVETGALLTNLSENYIFGSYHSSIEIFISNIFGNSLNNGRVLLDRNICDFYQDAGIKIHGTQNSVNAGIVELKNNLLSQSNSYGLAFVDGYVIGIVSNTGYYGNAQNKNCTFDEVRAIQAITYKQ